MYFKQLQNVASGAAAVGVYRLDILHQDEPMNAPLHFFAHEHTFKSVLDRAAVAARSIAIYWRHRERRRARLLLGAGISVERVAQKLGISRRRVARIARRSEPPSSPASETETDRRPGQ